MKTLNQQEPKIRSVTRRLERHQRNSQRRAVTPVVYFQQFIYLYLDSISARKALRNQTSDYSGR